MLTEESRYRDFPTLQGRSYLNTAAESVPPVAVGNALHQYWQDKLLGMNGRIPHFAAVERCREISAKFLALAADEVSFCSCSSEAYNLLASALSLASADQVVVSDLDFPAGVTPWLRAKQQPQLSLWKHRSGVLHLEDLIPMLSEKTALVQLSLVSFFNGFRLPWSEVEQVVRRLAPRAVLAVDVTQALGRIDVSNLKADIAISSTHKWSLGVHGGCIIGIPKSSAERLTTFAGGWYHLTNAFEANRFEVANTKFGAASYSVGMPNFSALYALDAALRYIDTIGLDAIGRHANPLVERVHSGLTELGLTPLAPWSSSNPSGIVAFCDPNSEQIHRELESQQIQVMHHAGRIRIAIHGYNCENDVTQLLHVLSKFRRN